MIDLDIGAIQHKLHMATKRLENIYVSGYENVSSMAAAMQFLFSARSDLVEAIKAQNEQNSLGNEITEE